MRRWIDEVGDDAMGRLQRRRPVWICSCRRHDAMHNDIDDLCLDTVESENREEEAHLI